MTTLIQCPACRQEVSETDSICSCCGFQLKNTPENYSLPIGTILENQYNQNQYRIDKILGQGGFGITYKGLNLKTNQEVAIKENWPQNGNRHGKTVIWPFSITRDDKKKEIEKFIQEAQYIYQCQHPNIVKIYDWLIANDTAYMVMEFLPGKSLADLLRKEGPLPESKVKNYFLQIGNALKLLHSKNLLHRDLKPDNIILDAEDRPVLIDFGNAREFVANKTQQMTQILTPGYAPLEQYAKTGKNRGPAMDIYSMCVSMYELLTGVIPPDATERLNSDPIIPPRKLVPNIDSNLEKTILKGMSIKVKDRFQSVDEVINALQGDLKNNLESLYLAKARQLVKEKRWKDGVRFYEQCLQYSTSIAVVELAMVLIYIDDLKAETVAKSAIKIKPKDGRGYGVLGLIKCRQANWNEALNYLETGVKFAPNESWIQANLAWAQAKLGKWQQANLSCQEAISLSPKCTFTLGLQAWIGAHQKQWRDTIRYSRQAIFHSKKSLSSGEFSKKLQSWVYPCLTIALQKAVVTRGAPDIDRCLEEFITQLPKSSFAWGFKGWKEGLERKWQDALKSFKEATYHENSPPWVWMNYGIAQENLNNIEAAIRAYQEYLHRFPENSLVSSRLQVLLRRRGN